MTKNVYKKISFQTSAIFVLFICFALSVIGQDTSTDLDTVIDAQVRNAAINEFISNIKENYFSTEIAAKMEERLKQGMANKEYDSITSARIFADTITSQLYEVCKDKHVYIRFAGSGKTPVAFPAEMQREGNFGISKAEILKGNIGYLKINGFPPPSQSKDAIAAAMSFLQNTDALIIDLREHKGGAIQTVALTVSYFVADKPVQLISVNAPRLNRKDESWTVEKVDAPRYLNKPVLLLTSNKTFSGGEEFAYDMQALKRATLVGETTGGGANPVARFPVQNMFLQGVSFAQAKSAITGTNWEREGVKPDIATTPEIALEKAVEEAVRQLNQKPKESPDKATAVTSNQSSTEISYPQTIIGKALKEFVEAINSGDKEQMKKFHLARLANSRDAEQAATGNSSQDFQLYQQTGGIAPKKIMENSETKIQAIVKTNKGNSWLLLTLEVEKSIPNPISDLRIAPTEPLN